MEMKERRSRSGEGDGSNGPKKDTMREKPTVTSDIKLKDVTIMLLPKMKRKEEGEGFSPFKLSRRLQRSPIAGEKRKTEVGEESEGGGEYPLGLATRVRR